MKLNFGVCILCTVVIFVGCNQERQNAGSTAPEASHDNVLSYGWPLSVASEEKLKQLGRLWQPEWHDFEFEGMKILIAVETMPSYGESYINVYGYVYNRYFKEWRRFLAGNTRDAGNVVISLDRDAGRIIVLGAANNDLNGKPLISFDLATVSDDHGYVKPRQLIP